MPWTHAAALWIVYLLPPPCLPGDLDRFPRTCVITGEGSDRQYFNAGLTFAAQERMEWLRLQRLVYPRDWEAWDEQINEQERIREAWSMLDSAWSYRDFYGCDCTDKLRELRELLGEQAYLSGQMPNPVPLWRYVDISR